jgi:hypothetical protein
VRTTLSNKLIHYAAEDELSATGEKILADRYLLKREAGFVEEGSLVYVQFDEQTSHYELARIVRINATTHTAIVELRDGKIVETALTRMQEIVEKSPEAMWRRVAKGVAETTDDPTKWEQKFFNLMKSWKYVPGGRVLSSAGTSHNLTTYNCFVVPYVGPSYSEFAHSIGTITEILSRSGGVGINLSKIPPQHHSSCRSLKAKILSLVLEIWHPDASLLGTHPYKAADTVVCVNEAFMEAVRSRTLWTFKYPQTDHPLYRTIWKGDLNHWTDLGLPIEEYGSVDASELYHSLLRNKVRIVSHYEAEQILVPPDTRIGISSLLSEMWLHGIRNVTLLTIAPTGTTGTMVGCATGCEPYYAWKYTRNSNMGIFEETAAIVEEYFERHPTQIHLPDHFVTSFQLTPVEHVKTQTTLQKWVDSSISKTCNVPDSYSVVQTAQLYELAYQLGCKGITIYRDGSRSEQILTVSSDPEAGSLTNAAIPRFICPNCSLPTLVDSGGCETCEACGFSHCSL